LFGSLTSFASRQFLERIFTADETWVRHYEPERKAQSMAWKLPVSPVAKKFKSQPSADKIMLSLLWNVEDVIMVHFTPEGETVNNQNCFDLLRTKLKPAIRSKRHGKFLKDAILLHDNARPHTANQTVETVNELGFEVMEQPPYSPDLAPSDFHMFGPVKEALRGRRFSSDEVIAR
jgi:histone-lysine N-methyltransferase SETMAR